MRHVKNPRLPLRTTTTRLVTPFAALMTFALASCADDDRAPVTGPAELEEGAASAKKSPSANGLKGKIVFSSNRDGDYEIFLLDVGTRALTQLTFNDNPDTDPHLSPNGKQIVYSVWAPGVSPQIHTMNVDGTGVTALPARGVSPTWSPNGNRILFSFGGRIYTMNPDGSGQTLLTDGQSPSWSSNGKQIVFHRTELYIMDANGGQEMQLTFDGREKLDPVWSSNGNLIAYSALVENNQHEIFVMDVATKATRQLTFNNVHDRQPSWSPDGKMLAFLSFVGGAAEIYVMAADGCCMTQLTHNTWMELRPRWGK